MSNFQTLTPIVEGLAGSAPQLWSAVTTDSAATVLGVGYLNDIAMKSGIKMNDIFYINTSDASTFPIQTGLSATLEEYQVTYSAGNWTLILSNPDNFAQFTPPSVVNAIPYFTNTTGLMNNSPFLVDGNYFRDTAANALTAFSTGGQASATLLTADVNNVTTVAAAADSVKLPASAPGLKIVVINSGANPMQVFGNGTDTINGVAFGTGISQLAGSVVVYDCPVAGSWYSDIKGANTYSSSTASATPGTIRALRGAMTGTATVMTSGNLVGVRGEVDAVGASGGFLYGAQGKVIATGTLSGSTWTAGVFGQLDISAATINAGQCAPIWGDFGASSGTLTDQTGLYGIAMTNTTAVVTQGQIYLYGGSQNLLLLSTNVGLSGVTYFINAGTGSGSWGNATPPTPSKVLRISVDGTQYYLPLVAQNT